MYPNIAKSRTTGYMMRVITTLALLVVLGSSAVTEKKAPWVEDLPEDEIFWGTRGLMQDSSMSMSMPTAECEIDVSFNPNFMDDIHINSSYIFCSRLRWHA